MKRNFSKSGFGLLEVVIAAGIISIFAGGVVLLSVASLRSSVINKHRTQAAALVQEAMEGVRVIRDSAWIDDDPATQWNSGLGPSSGRACTAEWVIYYSNTEKKFWTNLFSTRQNIEGEGTFTINNVPFKRKLQICPGPDEISNKIGDDNVTSRKVIVTVNWNDYGKDREVKAETLLTNWRAY